MSTLNGSRVLPRAIRRAQWQGRNIPRRRATTVASVEHHEPDPYVIDAPPLSSPRTDQKQAVRNAKPFSDFLTDTFHRQHDYLRISVTERCNLRCLYCMPEEGIELSPNKELLTTPEIVYLSALFVNQGVNKIRLTGGEPTVRKDIVPLMQQIGNLRRNGLKELALTTNAISLHRKLDAMVEAGLTGVNISLDTLDPFEFQLLTRRQGFDAVMKSINRVQEMNKLGAGVKLKINAVVMRGLNDHQIMPFVEKTRDEDIEVRFIEYMPFGGNKWSQKKMLPYAEMLDIIRQKYPAIARAKDARNDTSKTFQIPGFRGRIGFITSMTHNFCGTCNRLRITSDGNLKVCLHGDAEVSLRDILRAERGGEPIDEAALEAIRQLELDRRKESGLRFDGEEGWMTKEQQLLEVIGAAVKRKKKKHAGMGELENMKNRPMILIGEPRTSDRRHSPSRLRHRQPWNRTPLHLLPLSATNFSQIRCSSSDARNTLNEPVPAERDEGESTDHSEQRPDVPPTFGFQSLSQLFSQPEPRRRYSRPHLAEAEQTSDPSSKISSAVDKPVEKEVARPDASFFSYPSSPSNSTEAKGDDPSTSHNPAESSGDAGTAVRKNVEHSVAALEHETTPQAPVDTTKPGRIRKPLMPLVRRHDVGGPNWSNGSKVVRKLRSETAKTTHINSLQTPSKTVLGRRVLDRARSRSQLEPNRPWGLSREDMKTIDSITDPSSTELDGKHRNSTMQAFNQPTHAKADEKVVQNTDRLTHVNSSGEARIVDVGAKPATRRVAIATNYITFSNREPFRLIFENSNKKGDVLGVARVAGIMAAKRTSDLVPLCHPIAISKVEVDVKLEAPGAAIYTANDHGVVAVRALVECTGFTGVEMEALTAATVAALTVYDMCKAVDRHILIRNSRVIYKCGGKSGLHYAAGYVSQIGREYFQERNLELPAKIKFDKDEGVRIGKV